MSYEQRDRHLFGPGAKRILSLDGGGIRGILTLGMLEHVEAILRDRQPPTKRESFVLADYFDLIAGTSTGSIIATWLALGNTVASARELYENLGPRIFSKPRLGGQFLWTKFDHAEFERILSDQLSTATLNSVALRTGLLVTCKRVDTGSAWLQANNKEALYWKYDQYRELRHLVRASAAAPSFFAPTELPIGKGETGLFIDGALGGQNNPSLSAFLYATAVENKLNWDTGDDKLFLLSLGTGYKRPAFKSQAFLGKAAGEQALLVLTGLIHETSVTAVALLQALSSPIEPFWINREINGLEKTVIGGKPLLTYQRYDPPIGREELKEKLGLDYTIGVANKFERMDNGERATIARLLEIGQKAGAQIKPEIFLPCFDVLTS